MHGSCEHLRAICVCVQMRLAASELRAETPKNDNNNDIVRTDVSDDETDVIDENETPHPR